ncbi:MAG: glycosyltransferase [Lacunisphaera sp.]
MADNTFAFSLRKILGMFYARARLVPRHWGVLVPGSAGRRFMRLLGFSSERIYPKLYCTNAEKFSLPSKKRYRRALFVGRFEPEKNIANLLAGWREYRRSGGQLEELLLVGGGSVTVDPDPTSGVIVSSWKPQEEVRKLMQEAAVFILPSRRDHWGVVLLEAALCGCILVASSECGAAYDLIVPGENGIRFSGLSAPVIADALRTVDESYASSESLDRAILVSRRAGEAYSTAAFVASVRSMIGAIADSAAKMG